MRFSSSIKFEQILLANSFFFYNQWVKNSIFCVHTMFRRGAVPETIAAAMESNTFTRGLSYFLITFIRLPLCLMELTFNILFSPLRPSSSSSSTNLQSNIDFERFWMSSHYNRENYLVAYASLKKANVRTDMLETMTCNYQLTWRCSDHSRFFCSIMRLVYLVEKKS